MRRVVFVLFVLCALSVSAVTFDVSVFPSERTININDTALFEVEISHDSPVEEFFEVFSSDVTWDVRTEEVMHVGPGDTFKTDLIIRPLNLNPGAYNLPLSFKRTGSIDQQKKTLYIEILSPYLEGGRYLPAVRGVATVNKVVDPREGMTIKLSLENQNSRVLDPVEVKVRSNVINKDYSTKLGPLEKKTLTFLAELDPLTPPQYDMLSISIIVPEKEKAYQFDLFPSKFEVIPYGGVVPSVETSKVFLRRTETITLSNKGNRAFKHVYRVPAWFGKRLFMSSSPEFVEEKGGVFWEVPLDGGESAKITLTYNYRPLFWLFLLLAILVISYYLFRSPIIVEKRAMILGSKEGEITELKVVIELVNRGNKVAKHVKVMDLVPKLADVVKESKETMLKPTKVTPHAERGTLIRWDIDAMEPKEHRILMYKVKTKLGVVGGLTLPVTAVHFKVAGHERETVSNKPVLQYNQ